MREFEFNLSMEELEKRTNKDYLMTKKMLKCDAPEYLALQEGDKETLKHLVKAAYILEKINMQIDCHHNLEFKEFLEREVEKGNKQAELTKILFDAQKGMNAIDTMSNKINLAKGIKEYPGKGVYPEDLSKEEFHAILTKMINEGKLEFESTLFSRNEQDYFNYYLNMSEFIDGYDIRNSNLHGTQIGDRKSDIHYSRYLQILLLIILIVIKINDDICLSESENIELNQN